MAALRIQCFELNRGDHPRYGDSFEGERFGGDASGGKPRLPVGASRLQMTLAGKLWSHERFFHGLRNG